jgi:hypothetical protein
MRTIAVAFVLLCACLHSFADSWGTPQLQGKASARGTYLVRVVPGSSKGDVFGYEGQPKGPYATAEWHKYDGTQYQRVGRATLLNPIAPVDIEVTEKGNLITLVNWHNKGIGYVLAIFTPEGKVLKRYKLLDLYSERDVKRMRTTTSSIHWRCEGFSFVLDSPRELWIDDSLGGRLEVNVETGTFKYEQGGGSCRQ